MLIDVGSSARWVKICVEPTQSGLRAACLLAYRAAPISSGSPGFHRNVGSTAGVEAGTPMSTLAVSSAITTLPAVSNAASAAPECALAWVYAATNSAPLSRARLLSKHCVLVTAFASHPPTDPGSWLRQQEMFRTAIGSLLTTSRTAMPAQTQLWNAWHQCSAPLISTGPCASSAVPMPFVPAALSDQQNQGARLASVALARVAGSPHSARMRPVESVTVTTPPRVPTSCATEAAQKPSSVNTTSCSGAWSISATAIGASVRCGLTRYCSRQRCQEIATRGRTPGTWSSPCTNRSHAASTVPLPGLADMGSSRCRSVMVENRLWSILNARWHARSAPVAARRGRACSGPGTVSRVFLLRHSFWAVSQTGTPHPRYRFRAASRPSQSCVQEMSLPGRPRTGRPRARQAAHRRSRPTRWIGYGRWLTDR